MELDLEILNRIADRGYGCILGTSITEVGEKFTPKPVMARREIDYNKIKHGSIIVDIFIIKEKRKGHIFVHGEPNFTFDLDKFDIEDEMTMDFIADKAIQIYLGIGNVR